MRGILIYTELTIREARRHRLVITALGLGAAFVALFGVGLYFIHRDMIRNLSSVNSRDMVRNFSSVNSLALDSGFNFVVMAGLYVVSFLGVMLAVLTSVGTLAGEVTSHTIQALAVKPYRRAAIVLGKWLGLALMLTSYIFLLASSIVLVTYIITGYLLPNTLQGILLIALQALVMLSICILGGTRLSTIANGVVAFMLYGVAFVGGWIEQIGSWGHIDTAVDIGIASSLIVPSEAMWKMASYLMQPPVVRALGASPFSMAVSPSAAMLIYTIVYMIAMVALAVYSFDRRDL